MSTTTNGAGTALASQATPLQTLPPLPDPIETAAIEDAIDGPADEESGDDRRAALRHSRSPFLNLRTLRGGCYLLRYTPVQRAGALETHYDGTLRVERQGVTTAASGDLYLHRPQILWPLPVALRPRLWPLGLTEPNPSAGIPVFPRSRYRYYVRVTKILQFVTFGTGFALGFELHRFNHASRTWTLEGALTAQMSWQAAPPGYPSPGDYLSGQVKNVHGTVVGTLTMGWVSSRFRRAVIEIDRVAASEAPLDNGAGHDWRASLATAGWDVTVVESDTALIEPSGASWSDAELHAEMLARRDSADLDREWRYHLLCVRLLDSTARGIMYDAYGGDSNNIPREGAALSSHWTIPNTATWGRVRGQRFGAATAPYYRTAVHELGHAMGLYHNSSDNGFMHTTPDIAAAAVAPQQFPDNVQWSFAPDDARRLRHMPDPWVRPGGISFGTAYGTAPLDEADTVEDAHGLELRAAPLLETVPLGAPVRVEIELANVSSQPLPAPATLSLKAGFVHGRVVDPTGTVRTFWPLVRCIEEEEIVLLEPGATLRHSLTLLRGAEGALFPAAGPYRIVVEAEWELGGVRFRSVGEATTMVMPAADEEHARAALAVLSEPDALLTLALGGDHLEEGVAAIHAALESRVLAPHYEIVEAKRVGRRFGDRKADLDAALSLLGPETVLSAAEVKRAAELVRDAGAGEPVEETAGMLRERVERQDVGAETEELVRGL